MNWPLELAVLIAVAISLVGTFLARYAAVRLDWLDQPNHRKVHANPIPLLGGIAMYMAFLISVLVTDSRTVLAEGTTVLIGATLLLVVGVIDDQRGLSPRTKLLAQASAAILLDNMDGLSAGVAVIACAFFTLLALLQGQIWVSTVAAVLLGATLGFLRFNWNPATIFMGDAGSLLLGFLLAVLALKLRFPDIDPRRTWPIPLLVLAVPIFDTIVVTISRLGRGVPITSGGRDHVSHRLVRMGLSVRQAVGVIYLVAALCGAAAIAVLLLPSLPYVYALVVLIGIAGLVALLRLEQVDLSDTGQVARAYGRQHAVTRRVGHVLRPFGVRVVKQPRIHRSWGKLIRERRGQVSAAAPLWVRPRERAETGKRQ